SPARIGNNCGRRSRLRSEELTAGVQAEIRRVDNEFRGRKRAAGHRDDQSSDSFCGLDIGWGVPDEARASAWAANGRNVIHGLVENSSARFALITKKSKGKE